MLIEGHGWGTMISPDETGGYYRPIATLLHGILIILFRADPLPLRILSSLLHAGVAFLIGRLLLQWSPRAVYGALLFAVHPALADAFGWISAAPDLMAAGFLLAMLVALERRRASRTALTPATIACRVGISSWMISSVRKCPTAKVTEPSSQSKTE